jgi:hypothetical protein
MRIIIIIIVIIIIIIIIIIISEVLHLCALSQILLGI